MHSYRRACPRGHRAGRLPHHQYQARPCWRLHARHSNSRSLPVQTGSCLVRRHAGIRNRPRAQHRPFDAHKFLSSRRCHGQPPLLDRRCNRPGSGSHPAGHHSRSVRTWNRICSAARAHRKTHGQKRNPHLGVARVPRNNIASDSARKRIAVIPGDGIGTEVIREAMKVLRAVTETSPAKLEFTEFDWGAERYLRDATTLPDDAVTMLRRDFDAILFGAVGDPRVPSNKHAADILLGLRSRLDLYVNLRPIELLDANLTPLRDRGTGDINFAVLRENTEGLYSGIGGQFQRGTPWEVAVQEDINTRRGVERIIRYAFEYARERRLDRVCMSDKSNALTFGHELWHRVFSQVKDEYPDIESRHMYIDTLVMEMVRDPRQFQVIVTCNLFGDILSDLGAQLAGGLGLAPSGNIHPGRVSLFEPVHGSAPNIAGKNIANPLGSALAGAMMLEYLGLEREAFAIQNAARDAVKEGKTTPDLGGNMGTCQVGDWLAERISKRGLVGAGAQA